MRISVIGTGYVGLVLGACLADHGNDVICVDKDQQKIDNLNKGIVTIYEPGLEDLIKRNKKENRLKFTKDTKKAIEDSEIIFITVDTPPRINGDADLTNILSVAKDIGNYMNNYKIVITKSTVPVGTSEKIKKVIKENQGKEIAFDVVSNPEFLSEGKAVQDFLNPDRTVIGIEDNPANKEAIQHMVNSLYKPLERTNQPIIVTDIKSAELSKYASNGFLATKISFMNELSHLCDKVGADIKEISKIMGYDKRIGPKFLQAGLGYGGSCLEGSQEVIIKDKGRIFPIKLNKLFNYFDPYKNTQVLSFDLKIKKTVFKKILATTKRKFNGKIIKIRTKMNKYITATDDHPFIIYENNNFKIKLASELSTGEELPLFLNIPKNSKVMYIDLIEKISNSPKFNINKVRVRPTNKRFEDEPTIVEKLRKLETYKGRLRDILRSNCLTLKEFFEIEINISEQIQRKDLVLFTSKGHTTYCPAIIEINENLSKLLGYYASEGHIHYEKNKRGTRARIAFHFNKKEKEYINEVCNILSNLRIRYSINKQEKNNTISIIVSSRIMAFMLDDILKCGVNSYLTRVPNIIYSLNNQQRLSFLSTIFKGDGHINKETKTPAVVYDFGSISKTLINGMILLFHTLGIVPSYKRSKSSKSTDYAHFIRISSKNQIEKLPNFKDSLTQEQVNRRLANYKKIIKPTGFKNIKDYFATVKIKDIISHNEILDVYSLEVEDTNTFVLSNGIIVHNCFPKDVKALAQTLEKYNLNSNIVRAVDYVNERQKKTIIPKLKEFLPSLNKKSIAIWGLSFKPKTNDIREAPALTILEQLKEEEADIKAYDPEAMENIKKLFPDIKFTKDPYETIDGADALIISTEWDVFRELDKKKIKSLLKQPIIIDGRNIYNPKEMKELGFKYKGVGR